MSASSVSHSAIPARDEDSGLHDIRNLASSQRMRLSSRRSTQNPILEDDDILASTSAGWKAVALPEPARMVSLPELAELPTKAEVKAREKAQKAADKAAARESKKEIKVEAAAPARAPSAPPVAPEISATMPAAPIATAVAAPAPVAAAPATVTPIGARVAKQKSSSTKFLAIAGIGLAAAAGITIFVMTNKSSNKADQAAPSESSVAGAGEKNASDSSAKLEAKKEAPAAPTAQAIATDEGKQDMDKSVEAAAGSAAAPEMGSGSAAPVVTQPPPPAKAEKIAPPKKATPPADVKKGKIEETKPPEKPSGPAAVKTEKTEKPTKPTGKPGDPDFDALLKEAGVKDKVDAPKLEKKSLSGGEFKAAMAGITGIAQKCYAGTQGTALVKVSIAPSGKVQSVQVTGAFAGTPVGTCVENAVRGLSFPPWDGPPQSFGYSYLLAE